MKGIIFNNEKEAKDWDFANNNFTGDVTKYKYSRKPLEETTTMTKAQYAEYMGIPAKINQYDSETDEMVEVTNPEYTALSSPYTIHKCALIVNDDLDFFNEETEEYETPENVVDVSELLYTPDEE